MFDAIHSFLYDHKWLVVLLDIGGGLYAAKLVYRSLSARPAAPTPLRRAEPSRPASKPKPAQQQLLDAAAAGTLPAATEAGIAERLHKADQPTARIRPPTEGASQAKTQVMPSIESAARPGVRSDGDRSASGDADRRRGITETDAIRKADRLQELGFHHSIPSSAKATDTAAPAASAVSTTSALEPITPATGTSSAPSPADATQARLAQLGLVEQSSTPGAAAELDDILARLDQVLGDGGDGAGGSTPSSKPAVDTAPTAPAQATTTTMPAAHPPAAEAGAASAPAAAVPASSTVPTTARAATKAPLWARADAFDDEADGAKKAEEPKQMGLFDGDAKP